MSASVPDILEWQAAAPDVVITAIQAWQGTRMGAGVNETPFGVALVQRDFFETVAVRPLVGGFAAADFDHEDIVRPVVITYNLWQSRFRGASDAIGRTYIDDPTSGQGFRLVGVTPRGFVFPSRPGLPLSPPAVIRRTPATKSVE